MFIHFLLFRFSLQWPLKVSACTLSYNTLQADISPFALVMKDEFYVVAVAFDFEGNSVFFYTISDKK